MRATSSVATVRAPSAASRAHKLIATWLAELRHSSDITVLELETAETRRRFGLAKRPTLMCPGIRTAARPAPAPSLPTRPCQRSACQGRNAIGDAGASDGGGAACP